mgnify:CR=1 FL=1
MNHIRKSFDGVEVIKDISLSVEKGEILAIIGPSGSGKSTLLRCATMLETIDDGEIIYLGDKAAFSKDGHAVYAKAADLKKIHSYYGLVFQNFNLIEELTVFENIELPLENCGMKASLRKMKVEKALKSVLLNHRRNYFPSQLSGGQQQRVAIARAIVNDPKLILADEPTGNLDSRNGLEIMDLLTMLNDAGTTIVMVTHSEHDARYSHRIIHMLDGKPVSENFLKELAYTAN